MLVGAHVPDELRALGVAEDEPAVHHARDAVVDGGFAAQAGQLVPREPIGLQGGHEVGLVPGGKESGLSHDRNETSPPPHPSRDKLSVYLSVWDSMTGVAGMQ